MAPPQATGVPAPAPQTSADESADETIGGSPADPPGNSPADRSAAPRRPRPPSPSPTSSRTAKPAPRTEPPAETATAGTAADTDTDGDSGGVPATKRALRSQGRRTMRKLLDAAMVAFDKRGYHATRVNDVVEIAKTSHGTFYLYFSNKEDLLRALVGEATSEGQNLYDTLASPRPDGGPPRREDVYRWVRAYSDLWVRYAPLFRSWTDIATIDPDLIGLIKQTVTGMADALARQISRNGSNTQLEPRAAGMAVLAMLDRFHYLREFVGQPIDDAAIDTLTAMVYRSLFEPFPSA